MAGKKRTIGPVLDEDWKNFQVIRRKYDLSWGEVFSRFTMYQAGLDYIFQAPAELTDSVKLDLVTVTGLVNLWIRNIRANLPIIETTPTALELREGPINERFAGRPTVCIGAGPSLRDDQLERIARAHHSGQINVICCAHALERVVQAGIVPDIANIVDASHKMLPFIQNDSVSDVQKDIIMVMIVSADPDVMRAWKGPMYTFLSGIPQHLIPNADTYISVLLPEQPKMETGGNSGTFNMCLAEFVRADPIILVGMDLAYPIDYPLEKTMYYNAYMSSVGKEYATVQDMIDTCYETIDHPLWGPCRSDYVYGVFRETILELSNIYHRVYETRYINATEGGSISGGSFECMSLEDAFIEAGVE